MKKQLGIVMFAGLLGLLFVSRYIPNPWTALVADDWANLARSSFYASNAQAAATGLQDPNRPLSMMAVETCFRVFGTSALPWTLLSIAGNGLLVVLVALLAYELTGRRGVALIAGAFFAVTPNLVETYHWSTQILNEVSCALVWYAASAWFWVRYINRNRTGWLLLSVLTYLVAVFSYEAGLFLPAAYIAVIQWREGWFKGALRLLPFALVVALYGAWRMTDSFGMNQSWHYPAHMKVGISISSLIWNAGQVLQWWVGDHLLASVRAGWDGFAMLAPWTRRVLLAGNAAAVAILYVALNRVQRSEIALTRADASAHPGALPAVVFGLFWLGAAVLPQIVSYTASRLQVLPAIGIGIVVAVALDRVPVRSWFPLIAVPLWICLGSNQGTTEQFRQVGEFNRRLYDHVVAKHDEWTQKDIIVFDTAQVRHRQTEGLITPVSMADAAWAQYGNALLFRGFVPRGMIELASGDRHCPVTVVHDVENGARRDGDRWRWHERFNPSRPRETPIASAFYIDVFEATRDPSAP